ncbi:13497_t:CDS:1 [Gigaspora margarita]|uniref:13497_t:CDS:1 n=1 Tax=Gigaspora margarita TaxID=4874 RepID=A0ABN7W4G8_GIGMA|nr:13497_t:CDS:1 [Gigaspora margarita]
MPQKSKIWDYWTVLEPLTPKELSQLDSCSETSSNEDDTEDLASSSTSTQKNTTKPHPPVKCKYCPKKYRRGLATRMQKHTNDCLNAPELAKTIKKPKLKDSNLTNIFESNKQSTIENYID